MKSAVSPVHLFVEGTYMRGSNASQKNAHVSVVNVSLVEAHALASRVLGKLPGDNICYEITHKRLHRRFNIVRFLMESKVTST